jgi:hypothetical protein
MGCGRWSEHPRNGHRDRVLSVVRSARRSLRDGNVRIGAHPRSNSRGRGVCGRNLSAKRLLFGHGVCCFAHASVGVSLPMILVGAERAIRCPRWAQGYGSVRSSPRGPGRAAITRCCCSGRVSYMGHSSYLSSGPRRGHGDREWPASELRARPMSSAPRARPRTRALSRCGTWRLRQIGSSSPPTPVHRACLCSARSTTQAGEHSWTISRCRRTWRITCCERCRSPAGAHTVELCYESATLQIGLLVTVCAYALLRGLGAAWSAGALRRSRWPLGWSRQSHIAHTR